MSLTYQTLGIAVPDASKNILYVSKRTCIRRQGNISRQLDTCWKSHKTTRPLQPTLPICYTITFEIHVVTSTSFTSNSKRIITNILCHRNLNWHKYGITDITDFSQLHKRYKAYCWSMWWESFTYSFPSESECWISLNVDVISVLLK